MLYAFLKPFAVLLMRLVFGLQARGAEHVPRRGPVLLVANHTSFLDPPLIAGATPRQVSFLAKAELFGVPLFGWFIRQLGARPLRREGGDPAALRSALRVLQEGGTLLVFPEGTRTGQEGVLGSAKPGAGMLAVLSQATVVPVYVRGSGRAWPRGRRLPRPARVRVTFGTPLAFRETDSRRKDAYLAASRAMMAAIADLGDQGVGGVGVGGASASPKYIDGRNRQHGEARTQ